MTVPVCAAAWIPRLPAPVVVTLPTRKVRSVPPLENRPNELVPLVAMLPTVTTAAWPAVLSVTPLAPAPPAVVIFTGVLVPAEMNVNVPAVDVRLTPVTPVVETGAVAT